MATDDSSCARQELRLQVVAVVDDLLRYVWQDTFVEHGILIQTCRSPLVPGCCSASGMAMARNVRLAVHLRTTSRTSTHSNLLEAHGDIDSALEMKMRALEFAPGSSFVLTQIARSLWRKRDYGKTIEWTQRARAGSHAPRRAWVSRVRALEDPPV
jgi:hypothetical protein